MHTKVSEAIFSSYSAAFEHHYRSLVDGQKLQRSIRISRPQTDYICRHKPCCHCCFFSSDRQADFEDTLALMIGSCEVTVSSVKSSMLGTEFADIFEDRFTHFMSSPKYRVISTMGGQCVKIDIEGVQEAARAYFHWVAEYNDSRRSSLRGSFTSLIIGKASRKSSVERGEHTMTCRNLMVRTIDDIREPERNSFYNRVSEEVAPNNLTRVVRHHTGNPLRSAMRNTRFDLGEEIRVESPHRIKRDLTGYVRAQPNISRQSTGSSVTSHSSSIPSKFGSGKYPKHIIGQSFDQQPPIMNMSDLPEELPSLSNPATDYIQQMNTGMRRALAA